MRSHTTTRSPGSSRESSPGYVAMMDLPSGRGIHGVATGNSSCALLDESRSHLDKHVQPMLKLGLE